MGLRSDFTLRMGRLGWVASIVGVCTAGLTGCASRGYDGVVSTLSDEGAADVVATGECVVSYGQFTERYTYVERRPQSVEFRFENDVIGGPGPVANVGLMTWIYDDEGRPTGTEFRLIEDEAAISMVPARYQASFQWTDEGFLSQATTGPAVVASLRGQGRPVEVAFEYDRHGLASATTRTGVGPIDALDGMQMAFTYQQGRLAGVEYGDAGSVRFEYEGDRIEAAFEEGEVPLGRGRTEWVYAGDSRPSSRTWVPMGRVEFERDAMNNITAETAPGWGPAIQYTYDGQFEGFRCGELPPALAPLAVVLQGHPYGADL